MTLCRSLFVSMICLQVCQQVRTAFTTQVVRHPVHVTQRGVNILMPHLLLQLGNRHPRRQLMGRVGVATGIITLLMNRDLIESTTGIIPTTANPSTSSGVFAGSTMQRSS